MSRCRCQRIKLIRHVSARIILGLLIKNLAVCVLLGYSGFESCPLPILVRIFPENEWAGASSCRHCLILFSQFMGISRLIKKTRHVEDGPIPLWGFRPFIPIPSFREARSPRSHLVFILSPVISRDSKPLAHGPPCADNWLVRRPSYGTRSPLSML